MQVQPALPHVLQDGRLILARGADLVHLHPFGPDHIGDQHGVVRGQGPARLADDGRVRQVKLAAHVADAPHHVVGVLRQAVVGRAVALRAGALVVHTKTATDVDDADVGAQTAQFSIETATLAHPALNIADVGDLGAQVEVQQLEAIELANAAQLLDEVEDLGRAQAELGHGPTA